MKNENLPTHIGFILDGNRRWAKSRNLPTLDGHKKGYETLLNMAQVAKERGVKFISAYTFSTENWNRSETEVKYLMELALWAFGRDMKRLVKSGFKIVFLGRDLNVDSIKSNVPIKIREKIAELEKLSSKNEGTTLALCFNYGGQAEILDAAKACAQDNDFTEENFAKNLYHSEVPACDLIVRTSGEQRISGFQLWRAAYAEFMFLEKAWPDFTESDFDKCLTDFANRQRRFGK